jgi:methionine-rich copper-binding protein CopC
MSTLLRVLLISTAGLLAAPAFAHSTVKSTDPASGSILPASPARIVIDFNEPARLISVVVVSAGVPDRKVAFTPAATALSFSVPDPKLATGRNEIQWKALSKDGIPSAAA